jgi:hypothetical protein
MKTPLKVGLGILGAATLAVITYAQAVVNPVTGNITTDLISNGPRVTGTPVPGSIVTVTPAAVAAIDPAAAATGSYTTTMLWNKYPNTNAAGFRLHFGTGVPGVYETTFVVQGSGATSYVFSGQPGVTYRSAIQAFAANGAMSEMSPEVVWSTPALLVAPTGYRPGVIVYVP